MKSETSAKPLWMLRFAVTDLRSRISALKVFLACLILGVTLVAATASLYRVIEQSLLADTRALLGGDVELDASEPLPDEVLEWIRTTGSISLVRELDTMVSGASEESGESFVRVEILIPDAAYPLYGELQLTPDQPRAELTARKDDLWGPSLTPCLLNVWASPLAIRFRLAQRPFASAALFRRSRIDYEYRVQTDRDLNLWLDEFEQAFPDTRWDTTTFAERLDQIATALILIAFTTLL